MKEIASAWPPSFIVKSHPRTRHPKLKVSLKHGLELITPKRFNPTEIPFILEKNRSWIEKQLLKIQIVKQQADQNLLPEKIFLKFINQEWKIDYVKMNNNNLRLMTRPNNELVIFGNIDNTLLCKKLLMKWLRSVATIHLIPELASLSKQTKLCYKSATIRNQSSRWGSCSQDKAINLNFKLLFLPENLVRHVLIHELCHTVHFNHSEKFWRLVKKFDPDVEAHKKLLKKEDDFIPAWIRV